MRFQMKRLRLSLSVISLMITMSSVAGGTFDTFNLGSINRQQNWTTTGTSGIAEKVWDQEIKDVNGERVFRISNAVADNGRFVDQVYSANSGEVAGESGSNLYNFYNNNTNASATTANFYNKFVFRSATGGPQPNLQITLNPSPKQEGSRQSWVRILDNGTNFELRFYETRGNGSFFGPTTIATGLNYIDWHTLEIRMLFVDGFININNTFFGNDIMHIFLNGSLIHSGTSWETYYLASNEVTFKRTQAVNSVIFFLGTQTASTLGNGFYFKEVVVNNDPFPTSSPSSLPTTLPTLLPTDLPTFLPTQVTMTMPDILYQLWALAII